MTKSGKARKVRHPCQYCNGRGFTETGVGLDAVQRRYPEFPLRVIVDRGWLGCLDEDDKAACEAALLRFLKEDSREALVRAMTERSKFPWNIRTNLAAPAPGVIDA